MYCIFVIILCVFQLNFVSANDDYRYKYDLETKKSYIINNMQQLGIVDNVNQKWSDGDFITRRNAFEMAYIVVNHGFKGIDKTPDEKYYDVFACDITPDSYDYYLFTALAQKNLIYGKTDNGQIYAAFDEYITYNQAFAIIFRVLSQHPQYRKMIENSEYWKTENPYFKFVTDAKLINNNTSIDKVSLIVDQTQIDDYMPAYEFMDILYSALYVPHLKLNETDNSTNSSFTYYDAFQSQKGKEYNETYKDSKEYIFIP